MKILSWNVNGIRAMNKKKGLQYITCHDPDIVCLQETKCDEGMLSLLGYHEYWSCGKRKGYSGTVVYTKIKPISVLCKLKYNKLDEGRIIILEYEKFYLINTYFPNSGNKLERLKYRLRWDKHYRRLIRRLKKPIIMCGDFNISQTTQDIKYPKKHLRHPGYSIEERISFEKILDCGLIDIYRNLYPNDESYTFYSFLAQNFQRNIGYRCDLFCISESLKDDVVECGIHKDARSAKCSDHCPILLKIDNI